MHEIRTAPVGLGIFIYSVATADFWPALFPVIIFSNLYFNPQRLLHYDTETLSELQV